MPRSLQASKTARCAPSLARNCHLPKLRTRTRRSLNPARPARSCSSADLSADACGQRELVGEFDWWRAAMGADVPPSRTQQPLAGANLPRYLGVDKFSSPRCRQDRAHRPPIYAATVERSGASPAGRWVLGYMECAYPRTPALRNFWGQLDGAPGMQRGLCPARLSQSRRQSRSAWRH
jgi:hypothetical protein